MTTTPSSLQPITIVKNLTTNGVVDLEALSSTRGPANYTLTINIPNPSQNTKINVLTVPHSVATNFRVSARQNPDALTLKFVTSEESDVIIYINLLEAADTQLTVETVGLSSTADLIDASHPIGSTPSQTTHSTIATDMTSATMIDLTTMMTNTPSEPVVFIREISTRGIASVQATSLSNEPANYELVVIIPNPTENTQIGILTIPQDIITDLSITEDDDPERLTVIFRTPEAAYALVSISLKESADISFRVETTDSEASVEVNDVTDQEVTTGATTEVIGGSSTVVTTQPVESTMASAITDTVTPSIPMITSPSMGPLGPLSITRTLLTEANVVQASTSLDRPAYMTLVIYTKNPGQSTRISVLTDPQGLATNFSVRLLQDPEAFIMSFRTVDAADTIIALNLMEMANISFTVETESQGSAANQVNLFVPGASTMMPPITGSTPVVLMNTSHSVVTSGPSRTTIFINATATSSILIDVNGSAEFILTSDTVDGVQVERYTLPDLGSFMQLIITRPVNISVTVATEEDVVIVTTVMSMMSDAAVVTIVTEGTAEDSTPTGKCQLMFYD